MDQAPLSDQEEPPLINRPNSYQEALDAIAGALKIDLLSPPAANTVPEDELGPRSISFVIAEGPTESSTDDIIAEEPRVKETAVDTPAAKDLQPVADQAIPAPVLVPAAQDAPASQHKTVVAPEALAGADEHVAGIDVLADRFPESHINIQNPKESLGLSSQEAAARLIAYGPNALKPPPRPPIIVVFLKQFLDSFIILLMACDILAWITYGLSKVDTDLYVALAIAIVFVLTAIFTFVQELKASNTLAKFANLLQATCSVIRDGQEHVMDAADLVVGDVVKIKGGDKVPADCRILFSQGTKVDNSPLTGEVRPILLNNNASPPGTTLTESLCLAFKASSSTEGEALGLVIRTGDRTFIGNIANLTANAKTKKTTLQIEVERFTRFIFILSVCSGVIAFSIAIGRKRGKDVLKTLIAGFLVPMIACVPEGLPATVNSILSITANRMAKRNVLVKRLDCVETLGSTSLICTDKTGTLTKNQMTVTECWVDGKSHADDFGSLFAAKVAKPRSASNTRRSRGHSESDDTRSRTYSTASENDDTASVASGASSRGRRGPITGEAVNPHGGLYVPSFELFHRIGSVCNKAYISRKTADLKGSNKKASETAEYVGNASDIAILRFCHGLRSSVNIRQSFPVDFEIPFNSTNKWMLTICHDANVEDKGNNRSFTVMMKGAPEVIMDRCSTYLKHGVEHEIDETFEDEFQEAYERFGNKGSRVIGVCQRTFTSTRDATFSDETDNYPTQDLCFVGLFSITDPPRDGVKEAISKCHTAGIKVFMVTGDHHLTAKAIAKQVGILQEDQDEENDRYTVILGSQIESLTDEDWTEISKRDGVVFARTTPVHKMKIVQSNQKNGHVVAVTGDGVNDAPALKNANIGVAMGLSGSDVAREAAAIILLDDNFASIVLGIEQGRIIFDNLKKTVAYTLTHIVPEFVTVIMSLFFGLPTALSTLQILSIDLATELGPAISLAYEGAESDIMRRKPRDIKTDRLVSKSLLLYAYLWAAAIETIGCLFAYFWVFANAGISPGDLFLAGDDYFGTEDNPPFCFGGGQNQTCIDSDRQVELQTVAASSYYLVLTLGQGFHLFMCKTSRVSFFKHKHDNPLTIYGVLIQLFLVVIFVYVPGVQGALPSGDVSYPGWVCLLITGVFIWVFNEWRKWTMQRNPGTKVTKLLLW